ncbi:MULTISPECIES: flagellar motor switch protein FliG [unclassified Sphingobium]|jgi:flagellar motor switch protein FliG|uniref:flagellar motor switch protein FliG n=1 Tax=unclassified Sphingobium TaxID=2611147 RepID=UPI001E4FBE62|nr:MULTISPECIES: flagellar motor switch protein FliG [unclassified Sphingobium]GLI97762.1 flagellar motor switch protein FliG [Sphingobium sp. BS19]CAH0349855.1 Flagellar motor switch protein FliG [Sphingobium sp. CECT 9361]
MPDALTAPKLQGSAAAAVLLMLFDEDEAAEILSRLEPDEVRQLGYAMYDVADVEIDEVNEALDHFVNKAKKRTTIGYGASQHIRGAMTKALGQDRADNMLARITPPTRSNKLAVLKWLEAKEIAALIEAEHPQIMAIVLAHLDHPVAAEVLQLLPAEFQEEVIYRVATLGPVSTDALDDLEQLLMRGSPSSKPGNSSQRGGTLEAAAIMNNVRKENEVRIIKALAKRDKIIAQSIEEEMFVFDNLIDMDEKNLGALMRTIDNDVLVVALKGANDMLKGRIFGCMSARAASSIADELAERGPMRLADVIEAQKLIIATARKMAEAGTIMLSGKGNDFV